MSRAIIFIKWQDESHLQYSPSVRIYTVIVETGGAVVLGELAGKLLKFLPI